MSFAIAGIGTAVPGAPVTQQRAAEVARRFFELTPRRERQLSTLYRWTRVGSRHSVFPDGGDDGQEGRPGSYQGFFPAWDANGARGPTTEVRMAAYEEHATALAAMAAQRALETAAVEASGITHLVTVSCSGFSAPGVDVGLIKRLGLAPGVSRSHIGFMGCHGALNGLRVARSFVEADPTAVVLLCAVEICTLHAHYGWDPEQIVANAIFADGAAALVGMASEDRQANAGRGDGDGEGAGDGDLWRVTANGSLIMPDSEDAMTWKIADHGFEMSLSARVPKLIGEHLAGWLETWLGEHELSIEAVGSWAVHPGGPRILSAVGKAAGLDDAALEVSHEVLARYGNMSSPTVLFLLQRLQERNAPRPLVALGFGPGLAIEAALIG